MPWSNTGSLNVGRQGLAVAVASSPQSGSRLYAFGGAATEQTPVAEVEVYDAVQKTWAVLTALPTPRVLLAAATANGAIHVLGGSDGNGPSGTHEIFRPDVGVWETGKALPKPRAALAAVTGPDGKIYVMGGIAKGSTGLPVAVSDVDVFDPELNEWAPGPSMTHARGGLAACVVGGVIYAIGGSEPAVGTFAFVEAYQPGGQWTDVPGLPQPRSSLAAAAGPNGLVYAFGGLDDNGSPCKDAYGYDPSSPQSSWSVRPSLTTGQGSLAGAAGPDGLLYAVGGRQTYTVVEAFDTDAIPPDPYIGNGTYQSPDIILLGSDGKPVPMGASPAAPWNTLVLPNHKYPIRAVVHNDSDAGAVDTVVRFWRFPGGVGSTGTLIDVQYRTVPAAQTIMVDSASPFISAPAGQHACVAVSIANPQSKYFNVDPSTASEVVDPTVAQPSGSGHFGSAWRNTNSKLVAAGKAWSSDFAAARTTRAPIVVRIDVATTKVPLGWDHTGEAARLQGTLRFIGAEPQMPLFLVHDIRSGFRPADELEVEIRTTTDDRGVRLPVGEDHAIEVPPGGSTSFTLSGSVPRDAQHGDVYLVDVGAHYPATRDRPAASVRFLEIIHVGQPTGSVSEPSTLNRPSR